MNKIKNSACDALKIYAFFQVFGTNIYGSRYANIDSGKNNLSDYFISLKGWSKRRLTEAIRNAKKCCYIYNKKSDIGGLYVSYYRLKPTKQ